MSIYRPLNSSEALDSLVAESMDYPVVVFKHSNRCELSARANSILAGLSENTDPPVYKLIVQHDRALSNEIESQFGIRHESPQVIVFSKGRPVYDNSHRGVTLENVRSAVETADSTA